MRGKPLPIAARITLAGCLSLVLFALAMTAFIKVELERAIYRETDARVAIAQNILWALIRAKGTPTLVDGQLRLGTWLANGDNELVDRVHALTGADATLFAILGGRPMRVSTTIVKLDGSGRNVGTELIGPARTALDAGHSFAGVSPVAGRPFINRYDALRDGRGRIIGIVYSGIPLTTMNQTVAHAMQAVVFGTIVALLASLGCLYLAMKPLRRVFDNAVTLARGLANGDLEQDSEIIADDGLGQVNAAFREMIAYQKRMASIADALARGDFGTTIAPASARDRLGVAFAHMQGQLHALVVQLEHAAMTDNLTQLGNRRAFDGKLRAELERCAQLGGDVWLGIVDVDNFKGVNDENGHQHGDVVLSQLGAILRQTRSTDAAFRLGGDEFAVVLAGCSYDGAAVAFERIRCEAQGHLFGATVSIGFARSPGGSLDASVLLRQADAALYVCKQRGRNITVSFEEARDLGDLPQKLNVGALTRLIAEGDITIAFQPIWDIGRRSALGFEALARPNPKYGLSGPQEAFDIAARIGRAHELDRVCREAAIAQSGELPAHAYLFLNVSPETLARGELTAAALAAALAARGLPPERVVLEITERYTGAPEPVIAAALELQRAGFKLALDDTGAGNAGLEYLSRLPVDFIKIDATIVSKAPSDIAARSVVAAIVALARTTQASVIAEGIEDHVMLDDVRLLLGDEIAGTGRAALQGYFLGRPGPIRATLDAESTIRQRLGLTTHSELRVPLPS